MGPIIVALVIVWIIGGVSGYMLGVNVKRTKG